MMTTPTKPPILEGCDVLPRMHEGNGSPRRHQGNGSKKAKRKPARRDTAGRFAVLNAFVDFTMGGLTWAEIAVWLILWRDSRDGSARTSQADMARRAGVNVSTIKRAIGRLGRKGLLTTVFRGDLWHGPSRYAVHPMRRQEAQARK